jgi:hypothetical protein
MMRSGSNADYFTLLECFMKSSSRKAMETICYIWQDRWEKQVRCRKEEWQGSAIFTTKFVRGAFINYCCSKLYYLQNTNIKVPYPNKGKVTANKENVNSQTKHNFIYKQSSGTCRESREVWNKSVHKYTVQYVCGPSQIFLKLGSASNQRIWIVSKILLNWICGYSLNLPSSWTCGLSRMLDEH